MFDQSTKYFTPQYLSLHKDNAKESSRERDEPADLPFGWVRATSIAAGLAAFLWAWTGIGQSLWLDELHTSWVIADGWQSISARASAGNQSPWYFYLLFAVKSTVGIFADQSSSKTEELCLRLPSVIFWSISVGLVAGMLTRIDRKRGAIGLAAGLCGCILVDRLEWFYAVEARAYSLVQLLSLLAWITIAKKGVRVAVAGQVIWVILATALLLLHLTSGPAVLAQWLMLTVISVKQSRNRWAWLASTLWLAGLGIWLAIGAVSIWDRRAQWTAFAGDTSLNSVVSQFPILVAVVVIAIVIGFERARFSGPRSSSVGATWLWVAAAGIPLAISWLATRFEIAPIFHYRFAISVAMPLYLLLGCLVWQLTRPILRWLSITGTLVWLVYSQGTIEHLRNGQLMGPNRGEGWREATQFVSKNIAPQQDALWCYAGLLEGHAANIPLGPQQDEYLSFPLRGCYRVVSDDETIMPRALVGSSRDWTEQITLTGIHKIQRVWIVCRGTRSSLEKRLRQARLSELPQPCPIKEFGRVSVVCLRVNSE